MNKTESNTLFESIIFKVDHFERKILIIFERKPILINFLNKKFWLFFKENRF